MWLRNDTTLAIDCRCECSVVGLALAVDGYLSPVVSAALTAPYSIKIFPTLI